jgi:hypothetical protein
MKTNQKLSPGAHFFVSEHVWVVSFAIMSIKFHKLGDQWELSSEVIRITFGLVSHLFP